MKIILKSKKGFTMVELLVVIAIIGILSTVGLASFMSAQMKARDTARKSDLRKIQSALELYRSDNGSYPSPVSNAIPASTGAGCTGAFTKSTTDCSVIYMQVIPTDPKDSPWNSGNYYYVSSSPYSVYTLRACLENSKDNDKDSCDAGGSGCHGASANCPSDKYYVLSNP